MRILFAIYLPKLFCQVKSLGLAFFLPPNQSSDFTQWVTSPSFTKLHLIGHAIKFYHNSDTMHRQSSR